MFWHTKKERPDDGRRIFCVLGDKGQVVKETIRTSNTKGILYCMNNVERWCYIDELLEKTKDIK